MNTSTLTIKVRPELKQKAEKVADEMGFDLKTLLKEFLTRLARTKTVTFSALEEYPNSGTRKALKESAADIKAGRIKSFKNPTDALKYIDKMIENERKHRQN